MSLPRGRALDGRFVHSRRVRYCGYPRGIAAIVMAIAFAGAPLVAYTAEHMSALQFDETQEARLGFDHSDVKRFLVIGQSVPACREAARAFPDFGAVSGDRATIVHVIHQHAVCRAALKAQNASLGVFRVEDSLRGSHVSQS